MMKSPKVVTDLNKEETSHGGYGAALFHQKWKDKRALIMERDNHKCVICGSEDDLQIHHRQYHFVIRLNCLKNPWEYEDRLMITLCTDCHRKGHRQYKVPIVNVI